MQKVTNFIESYIQWVVLALGVLWLLWMGYAYWANPPAVANFGSGPVAPGDVEEELAKTPAVDGLEKAKANEGNYPEQARKVLLSRNKVNYVKDFETAMNAGGGPAPLASAAPFPGANNVAPSTQPTGQEQNGASTIPVIAGVINLETNANGEATKPGMSVVNRPDPNVPVVQNVAGGQQPQQLLQPPDLNAMMNPAAAENGGNPAAPGQAVPPPPPAPIAIVPEEVTWVTVAGTLDMKKLAQAFQKANIPQAAAFTSILRIELVREELDSKGTFTNQVVVKDLTNQFKPAMPATQPAAQLNYLQWAQAHVADIVQPPFYEVLRGDLWRTATMPEVADANANVQPAEFNPANVKPGEVPNLPPEQRQKWLQWKQEQDAQKNAARPKPAPSPTGGGGHNRGGGSFFAPVAGGEVPFGRGRPAPSRHGEIPFGQQPAGRLPSNVPPTANTPPQPGMQQQELPSSPFSPAQQLKDLEIWAHDETTIPGKVYRYKLRISIKSPLWGTQGMAKNPDDANVFVLTAETEWSKPIPSPSKQDFFVSTGGSTVGGVPKVGIDYFKWDDGTWKQTYVTLQPGDRVGETPWTIVDLRPIGNSAGDNRVVLVSDTGDMSSRFYKTDKANPRYNALHGLANPIAPAGTTPNSPQAGLNPGPTATGAAGGGRHSRTD